MRELVEVDALFLQLICESHRCSFFERHYKESVLCKFIIYLWNSDLFIILEDFSTSIGKSCLIAEIHFHANVVFQIFSEPLISKLWEEPTSEIN